MADHDESGFLEGFICPICKKDLRSPDSLMSHFQFNHSDELDLLKSVKGLFGKAKKFLKQDSSPDHSLHSSNSRMSSSSSYEMMNEPQDMGLRNSYTQLFLQLRVERVERLTLPTNQLIIRLGKLLDNMPTDPVKKKAHEQSIISWVDGTTVTRCPDCTGQFYLARRKHHCRTCGGIMCDSCSHFVQIPTARKILDLEPLPTETDMGSVDNQLRLCVHCISLLETRERKREMKEANPVINQMYNILCQARQEAEQISRTYMTMYNSLSSGETKYNLNEAQVLRVRLVKLADTIEAVSGKIASLPETDEQNVALSRLKSSIRTGTAYFMRNNLLGLPTLPSDERLLEIQQKKREYDQHKLEEKLRQQASLSGTSPPPQIDLSLQSSTQNVVLGQGWIPGDNKNRIKETSDPLLQQMNIIRAYIQEARAANRLDEVASLEENLKELKKVYWENNHGDIKDSANESPEENISSNEENPSN